MPNTAPVVHSVHSDPDILGGIPVFVGTRVPFRNLIDYLERNHSLDEFLDSFQSVSREQAVASLEAAHEAVSDLALGCAQRPAGDGAQIERKNRVVSHWKPPRFSKTDAD